MMDFGQKKKRDQNIAMYLTQKPKFSKIISFIPKFYNKFLSPNSISNLKAYRKTRSTRVKAIEYEQN